MRAHLLPVLPAVWGVPNLSFATDAADGVAKETAAPPSPLGFAGEPLTGRPKPPPSQTDTEFVPFEDRWRIPLPRWNRYPDRPGQYPYVEGHWWDPYNQNVLKGDYPILGQHTFLDIKATSLAIFEERQVPTPTTPFESTTRSTREEFFGSPNQFAYNHYFILDRKSVV